VDSRTFCATGIAYNTKAACIATNGEYHERESRIYDQLSRQFNARLSAKKHPWFWPTLGAALASKHHWLIIACDACNTVIDLDLTVKRRDPDAPIRLALNDVRCPRCNGHGRTRIVGLSRYPSI